MYNSAGKNNSSFRAQDGNMTLSRAYQTTRRHIKKDSEYKEEKKHAQ